MSGIYSLLSAAKAHQRNLETTANNIANVNTVGFKADRPVFKQYLDKAVGVDMESEEENFTDNEFLTPYSLGSSTYVVTDDVLNDMEPGGYDQTGLDTDIAITGDGFFAVDTPYGRRYTRNGQFNINKDGFLVTAQGHYVLGENGPMQVNEGRLNITDRGQVQVDQTFIDRLMIKKFDEPAKLTKMGGNYFSTGGILQEAKEADNIDVRQGMIERSNVNTVGEMTNLININRSYQAAQRAIRTIDDLDERSISLSK